jgi:tetratricopeptide (TPR) repeat protein
MPAPGEVHFLVLDPDRHPDTFGLKEDAVMTSRYFAFALIVLLLAGAAVASAHDGEKLGTVHFPVSCAPAVQADFERAVALLHSFWYEEALKAFTAVTAADASCAMGYWGVAMSVYYPLWQPPSPAMLEKGSAAVDKARALNATPREKDYIGAIGTYYRDHDKLDHRTRALAYEKAMEQVYRRYPDDREAAVFYALALNATAAPTDKTYANQLKAGAILDKVFAEQPDHPGVAHYIIHSYDYPPLANRGLVAARGYAKTAPSVPHAQHMPSHIFTRLGVWLESIDSNRASADAGKAYYAKLGKDTVWDQTLHALDYVVYAYLQTGQDKQARAVLEELGSMQKSEPESFVAAYAYAAIPARLALEQHRWSEAATLSPASKAFPWDRFAWAEAITSFARAVGAGRSGDAAKARAEVQKLDGYRTALVAAKQTYWAEQVNIQQQAAAAWVARAEGKNDEALKLMRAAADLEDSTEKHPVTPAPVVPARELLGEMLLDLNQPAQALIEFEVSAAREPNRFSGIFGAARAAELSGDRAKAKTLYAKLVAMCDRADDRPELRQAKAALAK